MSRRIILTWNGSADYTSKSISNISGIDPKGRVWHVNSDLYCNFVTCYLDGQEETMVTASLALDGNSHPLIHTGNTIYDWATPRAWNVCKYHEIWILSNVLISFQLCIKLLFFSRKYLGLLKISKTELWILQEKLKIEIISTALLKSQ